MVVREVTLVREAIGREQSLFPWLICGLDFDNHSAFMNDVLVPWCRASGIELTRSRAYKKNDQAIVEQKNGAVVRRLVVSAANSSSKTNGLKMDIEVGADGMVRPSRSSMPPCSPP